MFCFSSINVVDEWETFPSNIKCEEMIGQGAFGSVFIARMDASVLIQSRYVKQQDGMPLYGDKNAKVAVKCLKGEMLNY